MRLGWIAGAALALAATAPAWSQEQAQGQSDAELAHQLANPVAGLISVPFQLNYDCCTGARDDGRTTLNVQPVIPVTLNENWSVIIRTIVPLIHQEGARSQTGFGDTTQSFFFTPPSRNGFTWAIGPALFYPTGTEDLSAAKWGAGPTALLLKQQGHVTVGILANHIWSVGGDSGHPDLSNTFLQPFFNYTFPDSTGIQINSESTYDWEREEWTVPINVGVTHVFNFSGQRVQLGLTGRAYLDGDPDWGVRFTTTLLFPK
jgi:hypothetical protein